MSDCTIIMPACYNEIVRKARKEHRCSDCRGKIGAGERYHYISGIWDGEPHDYKQCADCRHMRCEVSALDDDAWGCGVPLGGLVDELDSLCETYRPLVAAFNAYSEARGGVRIA